MSAALWKPSPERIQNSNFTRYFSFLEKKYGLKFNTYNELYQWSITDIARFWESIWKFYGIVASNPYEKVFIPAEKIFQNKWFPGAKFNFAQNLLKFQDDHIALLSISENRSVARLTYKELYLSVAQCAKALRMMGIKKGDRVCGFMPNIPETVIAMLATSSIGAIWSSCSADFGVQGVLDRFGQIEPTILFAVDGYTYNGKPFNSLEKAAQIAKKISSLKKIVIIPYLKNNPDISETKKTVLWSDFLEKNVSDIIFEQLPFDHPLYVMYSSGTTGVPKCIVHGQGGTLIQHLKELMLHTDLKREDTICYVTTCGWMMWNWLVSSLSVGATVVLYEGSITYPDIASFWKNVEKEKINILGTSPKFISLCQKAQIHPKELFSFSTLKTVLSTGSPLSKENFQWIYENLKEDIQLSSICGGTDIISCFMLGNPWLPVYEEEIQCRGLGMKVDVFDEDGKSLMGQKGELVCTASFPSMPVYFWNDPGNKKYQKAYFNRYQNVWHHGDYVELTNHGGMIVYGRSDATLNPGGVRIGTSEIYRQVEQISEIKDSIAVGQQWENDIRIILFVILKEGSLTDELILRIKKVIKEGASPRHVPSKILTVRDIPYTLSGKKVEMAVTQVIHGEPVKNKEALMNPQSLEEFKNREELTY